MNKKKLALVGITIIAIVVIIFIVVKAIINKKSSSDEKQTGVATVIDENNISIKSIQGNKIEKDGVEATEIKLQILDDQLEVKTTIKNNSSETLNGYQIEIALLDEENNEMTIISDNSSNVIEPGKSLEIVNYVMGLENANIIRGAKIKSLEKNNIQQLVENTFEEMVPEEIENAENTENGGNTEEITGEQTMVGPQQEDVEE